MEDGATIESNRGEQEGRCRGLDVDSDEDDTYSESSTGNNESKKECELCKLKITSLQNTIDEQALKIAKLQEQLDKYAANHDENQSKKRKRENQNLFDTAIIEDSSNKDILINKISEENKKLKQKLHEKPTKPTVEDKSTEAKHRSLPIPNISDIVQQIDERFNKMQAALGTYIEEKIENKLHIGNEAASTSKSYANAVTKEDQAQNFREIVAAAKNEELAEEREKNFRLNNIIIHGFEEANEDQSTNDEVLINKLISDLSIGSIQTKTITRLGQHSEDKSRPIKVSFNSLNDKDKIMNNLPNLKDKGYKGISITHDYTLTERKMVKDFVNQARKANENEKSNSDKFWVVRGSPKNGLFLKKVTKRSEDSAQIQ